MRKHTTHAADAGIMLLASSPHSVLFRIAEQRWEYLGLESSVVEWIKQMARRAPGRALARAKQQARRAGRV